MPVLESQYDLQLDKVVEQRKRLVLQIGAMVIALPETKTQIACAVVITPSKITFGQVIDNQLDAQNFMAGMVCEHSQPDLTKA